MNKMFIQEENKNKKKFKLYEDMNATETRVSDQTIDY